jgi:hypothetical protein
MSKKPKQSQPVGKGQVPAVRDSLGFVLFRNAIVVVAFFVIGSHLFSDIDKEPFHLDEPGWFSAGYDSYQLMFVQRDFDMTKWENPRHRTYGWINLPLGKYLIGLALDVYLPRGEYFYEYDFSKNPTQNLRLGNAPPMAIAYPARFMAAIFSFASCVCMFWFCMKSWNWLVGVAAAILLGFNSLFTKYAHLVMTDAYLVFFFLLSVVVLNLLYSKRDSKTSTFILISGIYGIVVGLCTSVKLNGAVGIVYLFILFVYLWSVKSSGHHRSLLLYGLAFLLSVLITAATVIILNPYFYTTSINTMIERGMLIVTTWSQLVKGQERVFLKDVIHPLSMRFAMRITYDYFYWVFSSFALIGLGKAVIEHGRDLLAKKVKPSIIPLIFFLVNIIAISGWISLDWDRYYLPLIIVEIPFAAYGMFVLLSLIIPKSLKKLAMEA